MLRKYYGNPNKTNPKQNKKITILNGKGTNTKKKPTF